MNCQPEVFALLLSINCSENLSGLSFLLYYICVLEIGDLFSNAT